MNMKKPILSAAAAIIYLLLTLSLSEAAVIDNVAAFVDDEAITLLDLNNSIEAAQGKLSKEEALDRLINKQLILREARRLKIETLRDEDAIAEYIDLKIRPLVRIAEQDMKSYYDQNKENLGSADFPAVKDSIERLLEEKEINRRLFIHIGDLRKRAYIKVFLR